ncbi:ATP synthase E chain-domain-containing protein [Gongronella butleri]|nr:ATP synthase E chain-domain-containing protein [Gongronella butleri]
MNQSLVNVGRWSALGLGVVYGAVHNCSLQKDAEKQRKQADYHHKELLIQQAKAAYAKQQASKVDASVELDIEDPNFDFEKYIAQLEKQ